MTHKYANKIYEEQLGVYVNIAKVKCGIGLNVRGGFESIMGV
jgi:hypothetical protein